MNNWDPLETQLRSWTPRAPSAKLKARLFETPAPARVTAAAATIHETNPAARHWLAPAMALFLLGAFVFSNGTGGIWQIQPGSSPSLMATAAISEPHLATYFASTHHSDNNTLQAPFEWTNSGSTVKTAPSMATTNVLMQ